MPALDGMVVDTVDLLTRSMACFAKPVELFDQHGVSLRWGGSKPPPPWRKDQPTRRSYRSLVW